MARSERPARGATIIDVAAHAGVSPMTVSRVINAVPGVRAGTQARVQAAIRALHYTPNLVARSLVTAREARIAVLYANPGAAFMGDFLTGVFEEASACAAQLLLLKGADGGAPPAAGIDRLIGAGIGGAILAPPLGELVTLRATLRAAGLPVAVVGGSAQDAICVRIDDRAAARQATDHLIALGHRRIGFIPGHPGQSASADRRAGFDDAVGAAGGIAVTIAPGDFSYASGLVAAERLLDAPSPPTAILAANDDMAAAVVSVAHRRRLDVPRDLSVVGFDDSTAATTLWPPLTTVRQPVRMLAAEAFHRLIAAMRVPQDAPRDPHILPHLLIERQSTAPPPR